MYSEELNEFRGEFKRQCDISQYLEGQTYLLGFIRLPEKILNEPTPDFNDSSLFWKITGITGQEFVYPKCFYHFYIRVSEFFFIEYITDHFFNVVEDSFKILNKPNGGTYIHGKDKKRERKE